LLPNHEICYHCLWMAYFLIRGFTLTYTLHHVIPGIYASAAAKYSQV